MPDSSRDARPEKPQSEKKQPETVLLTAEELRAIAGGGGVSPPPITGQSATYTKPTGFTGTTQ